MKKLQNSKDQKKPKKLDTFTQNHVVMNMDMDMNMPMKKLKKIRLNNNKKNIAKKELKKQAFKWLLNILNVQDKKP